MPITSDYRGNGLSRDHQLNNYSDFSAINIFCSLHAVLDCGATVLKFETLINYSAICGHGRLFRLCFDIFTSITGSEEGVEEVVIF